MLDLSLFKPLCDELNISINDLISGEKVKEKEISDNILIYKSFFYNTYIINYDTNNEYYILVFKKEYYKDIVPLSPFGRY